ncbi:hypothetical protein D3C75_1074520 [compost metagenome]
MGVNHADVFAVVLGFDEAFHDFFPFAAGKVARLGTNDFHVRRFRNGVGKTFLTVDCHACAHGALQLNHVTLFTVKLFEQPLADQLAFQHVVGGHYRHVQRFVFYIDITVEQEYRDFCLFCFL